MKVIARQSRNQISEYLQQRRKGRQERVLSFRTKREIFLRSRSFVREDGPWLSLGDFATWRETPSAFSFRSFAQAKQILNYSITKSTKVFVGCAAATDRVVARMKRSEIRDREKPKYYCHFDPFGAQGKLREKSLIGLPFLFRN